MDCGHRESSVEAGWLETEGQRGRGPRGHRWGRLLHALISWAVCPWFLRKSDRLELSLPYPYQRASRTLSHGALPAEVQALN